MSCTGQVVLVPGLVVHIPDRVVHILVPGLVVHIPDRVVYILVPGLVVHVPDLLSAEHEVVPLLEDPVGLRVVSVLHQPPGLNHTVTHGNLNYIHVTYIVQTYIRCPTKNVL